MTPILRKLEKRLSLKPKEVALLLGYQYVTYSQYRSGLRAMPNYCINHIEAILLLQDDAVDVLIRKFVHEES